MATDLRDIFLAFFRDIVELLPNLIMAFIVLLVFIFFAKFFYKVVGLRIQKRWRNNIVSGFLAESVKWIIYISGILIALNIMGFSGFAGNIVTGAGVSAIILGFAFKDIGENFLAGILLTMNRPFEVGDIIEVEGQKGTVQNLDLRLTHLRNAEGKDIFLPNAQLVKNTVINFSRDGYLRINFMIGIAPECNIDKARQLIMQELKKNKRILSSPPPNVLVEKLGEFTTDLQVLFWVDILEKRKSPDTFLGTTTKSEVIESVKAVLDAHDIYMPAPVIEHKNYMNNQLHISEQSTKPN